MKILIVDDDPIILFLLNKILTNAGHDIVQAEEGNKALEYLSTDSFNLMITDINMPNGMGGFELLDNIKSKKIQPEMVKIIISGFLDNEKIAKKYTDILTYLPKPIAPNDLIKLIDTI